jgi:hypothetical protein
VQKEEAKKRPKRRTQKPDIPIGPVLGLSQEEASDRQRVKRILGYAIWGSLRGEEITD